MITGSHSIFLSKGNSQNYFTRTGPTMPEKRRWSLSVPSIPHLPRWSLRCIALILSGVKTEKKIPWIVSLAMQALCKQNIDSLQILRPLYFVHVAHQIDGVLYNPPTTKDGGSSSSTLVMTTSLTEKKTTFDVHDGRAVLGTRETRASLPRSRIAPRARISQAPAM